MNRTSERIDRLYTVMHNGYIDMVVNSEKYMLHTAERLEHIDHLKPIPQSLTDSRILNNICVYLSV